MGERWEIIKGTTFERDIEIQPEGTDQPATGFTGAEALRFDLWPGGTYAALTLGGSSSLTWKTPAAALITQVIHQTDTVNLPTGPLRYQAFITTGGRTRPIFLEPVVALVRPVPGTTPAPATYAQFEDIERVAPWIVQTITDNPAAPADFRDYLGRARARFDEMIVSADESNRRRYERERSPLLSQYGQTSEWVRDQLAANRLLLAGNRGDRIREINARFAVAYICESMIGVGPGDTPFQQIARQYERQALSLCVFTIAQLDTNGDGEPDYDIPLGWKSTR